MSIKYEIAGLELVKGWLETFFKTQFRYTIKENEEFLNNTKLSYH